MQTSKENKMQLKENTKYVTGNGTVVGPLTRDEDGFWMGDGMNDRVGLYFGMWKDDGTHDFFSFSSPNPDYDIVREA
jgi:hypothetical protein